MICVLFIEIKCMVSIYQRGVKMQEDNTVVVASYLVVGLTEEDVYYTRKHLEAYKDKYCR